MIPTVFESASGSRLRDSPHRPRGGFRYTRNLCDFAPVFTGFRSVSSDFHLGLGSHAFGRPLKVFFLVTDMIRGMLAAVMRRIPRLEGPASRKAAFFFSRAEFQLHTSSASQLGTQRESSTRHCLASRPGRGNKSGPAFQRH